MPALLMRRYFAGSPGAHTIFLVKSALAWPPMISAPASRDFTAKPLSFL